MENVCMDDLNRPHSKFNLDKSKLFGADTLFSYNNPVIGKEFPDGGGVELVLMKTTEKIYDSIESNGFLFSEETSAINEDEYAIISDSDCDCYSGSVEDLANEVGIVSVVLQNGDRCKRNGVQNNKTDQCSVQKINKSENAGKQVHEEPNGNACRNQAIVSVQFSSEGMNGKCSRKASKLHVDDMNKISTIVSNTSRENDDDHEIDEMYSFENTATPNKDYEMKILAGRNDVSEVILQVSRKIEHCNERSLEEEDEEEEERKPNSFKLRDLTSRVRKSREDISLKKETEYLRRSSEEELQNHNNTSGDSKKGLPVPRRPFAIPTMDIKNAGPIIVNSNKKQLNSKESTINTEKRKGETRSSNSSPGKFDLDMTCIQHHTATTTHRPRGKTKNTRFINENEHDESFFEIDDRYGEYNHDVGIQPIELEMKTIMSSDMSGDITDGVIRTTDFTCEGLNRTTAFMTDGLNAAEPNGPRASLEVLRDCAVSCRYISIYKQEKLDLCKYINIAFINVNPPRKMLNYKLDVPCEEIIEDVYTHLIEEMIIYDDEKDEYDDSSSSWDDEWHIIR